MLHARFRPIPCTVRADRPELVSHMSSQPAVSRQQLVACHAARCRQCCMQHAATAASRQPCSAASAGSPLEGQQPQARRHCRRVAKAAAAAGSDAGGGDADMEAAARGEISEESEPHATTLSATHCAPGCFFLTQKVGICCSAVPFHAEAAARSARTRHCRLSACVCMPPVMDRINKATQVIGTMIAEVSKDVFVADPSGEQLSGGTPHSLPPLGCPLPLWQEAAKHTS